MSTKTTKINFTIAGIFSILSALTAVAVAYLGAIMEAATSMDMDALKWAVILLLATWPIEFLTNLIAHRFRIHYVTDMIRLVKDN
jgi:hypothetical protein